MTHEEVLDEVNVIYERISNNENNLFSDGNYIEALEILIDFYETGLIEELEKIKEEINSEDVNCRYDEFAYSSGLQKTVEMIDKHIEKLKGETNE